MENDVEIRLAQQRCERYEKGRAKHLERTYGITLEQYDELLESQGGVCAICREMCVSGRRLCVDHDHDTGKVRGLLCGRCNFGIGSLRTIKNLAMSIAYLENYKESA
ncbi:hypothetical protein EBS40_07195 [bacterium]|nr:hypothetical protein [bacterium]